MEAVSPLVRHHTPVGISDRLALAFTKFLRFFADIFFAKRYGHRAVVLETVAAVPRMEGDNGWIQTLLNEAENERMHLMTFVEIANPSKFERFLILMAQGIFYNFFFMVYFCSPRTAHRIVGYFEEEAVYSYTEYLENIDKGVCENVAAPQIAIEYWNLAPDARLREVVLAVRNDEALHRDVNHQFADDLS